MTACADSDLAGAVTLTLDIQPNWPVAFYRVSYSETLTNLPPLTALDAPADDPVVRHLPAMAIQPENEDDVQLFEEAIPVSVRHLLATLKNETTVGMLNNFLAEEKLSIAGTAPVMNLVLLRRSELATPPELLSQLDRLSASGLFDAVALNIGLSLPEFFDEPPLKVQSVGAEEIPLDWTWEAMGLGFGLGGNNAFEMSRIPQLWNWLDFGQLS